MAEDKDLRTLVAEVAAAYFANNHVASGEISAVVQQVAASLLAVGAEPAPETSEAPAPPSPKMSPAQVRKSIRPDALISFEDNKPYKTLRRHLTVRGLSPEQYREKHGLPSDYPMVAPSYSETRSRLARAAGLGGARAAAASVPAPTIRAKGLDETSARSTVAGAPVPGAIDEAAAPAAPTPEPTVSEAVASPARTTRRTVGAGRTRGAPAKSRKPAKPG